MTPLLDICFTNSVSHFVTFNYFNSVFYKVIILILKNSSLSIYSLVTMLIASYLINLYLALAQGLTHFPLRVFIVRFYI